jgi:uncharacterized membrane protein YgcG
MRTLSGSSRARSVFALLALAPLVAAPLCGQPDPGRTLRWDRLEVRAHLDAEGRLLVLERHEMVFDGAWNGGERIFRVELGQDLELVRLSREAVGPGGEPRRVDLVEDEALDDLDDYAWHSGHALRWRSRLPSDPPFENAPISYELEYVLGGVLQPQGGDRYLLDHDFAFPDREWPMAELVVRLTLDPAWSSREGRTIRRQARNLGPGSGLVVTLHLAHEAPGHPAAVWRGAPAVWRLLLSGLLVLASGLLFARLWRRERRTGRLEPLPEPPGVDREWLERHLFSFRPEVAGALWDERTGAPEVTALLARLELEGKIASRVEAKRGFLSTRTELHLELEVPLARFTVAERPLIDALFLGSETTSTSRVREHYRKTGFQPAAKLGAVKEAAEEIGGGQCPRKPSPWPALGLVLAGVALLVLGLVEHPPSGLVAAIGAGGSLGLYGIALAGAASWRRQVRALRTRALVFAVPCLFLLALVALLQLGLPVPLGWLSSVGLALWVLGLLVSVTHQAMGRQSGKRIELRRNLVAARELLRRELRRERPDLDDAWLPWMLGLGLGSSIDRWSVRHPGAVAAAAGSGASFTGPGGSGSGGFTGGGGTFGGAGASAAWSSAVAGMAAGVAAPSSSGSGGGGGGGGGGGSSGGGGGGGW